MVDPKHEIDIPTGRRDLAPLLRQFFRRLHAGIRGELLAAYRQSRSPRIDLAGWTRALASIAYPTLEMYFVKGADRQARELASRKRVSRKAVVTPTLTDFMAPAYGLTDNDVWSVFNPEVEAAIRTMVMNFAASTMRTTIGQVDTAIARVREAVRGGLVDGDPIARISADVRAIFDDGNRAFAIAATEASRAMHSGQQAAAIANGMTTKELLESADACEVCKGVAKKGPIPIGVPFLTNASKNPAYATVMSAPIHVHCVLGDTPVWGVSFKAATRMMYHGPIIRVDFGVGMAVSVTANHMILTDFGFVRAVDLMEGDNVIRCGPAPIGPAPSLSDPNENWCPPTAQEVFSAFNKYSGVLSSRVPVAPEYLHGDGRFGDGYIHVVRADGFLRLGCDPRIRKPFDHLEFIRGDDLGGSFPCSSDIAPVLKSLANASHGGVGVGRELAALLRSEARVANKLGFGTGTDLQSHVLQTPNDTSAGDVKALRHCQDAFPGIVTTAKIVKIDVLPNGHAGVPVYDFETSETVYTVGHHMVGSNCMCTEIYDDAPIELGLTAPLPIGG